MNKSFTALFAALAFVFSGQAAELTTKISNVHLCCQSCVKGVEKALADVKGVTAKVDKDAETVTVTGTDKASLQKAADALVAAGYYGVSSDTSVKLGSNATDHGRKVQKLKVEGVHLCCGKCVSTVDKAVKSVAGVKEHTAVKNAESFEVSGDFNDQDVVQALHKAGLSGKIVK